MTDLPSDITTLSALWVDAKATEENATARRRHIEDHIRQLADLRDDAEGTKTIESGAYAIKVTFRIDRNVDADKLQEIAIEHGLMDHLSSLFRWKPEINATAWKQADPAIVRPLADAITAKPGRPSFKITIAN